MPAAPTQAGRLIPRHGMMLWLIPSVAGNDGERQRRVYKAQQTPAEQPHRGGGRNILVGADSSVAVKQLVPVDHEMLCYIHEAR